MKVILTLFLLIQFTNSNAQLFDHLEPVDVNFLSYYPRVNVDDCKKLMADFDHLYRPRLRFVIVPLDSLETLKAVEISYDSVGNNKIKYRDLSKGHHQIIKKNKEIPTEIAEICIGMLEEALKDTKYNNVEQNYVGDDVDYAFPNKVYYFYEPVSDRSGKTVYPTKGKKLIKLISFCELLIEYANDRITEKEIRQRHK